MIYNTTWKTLIIPDLFAIEANTHYLLANLISNALFCHIFALKTDLVFQKNLMEQYIWNAQVVFRASSVSMRSAIDRKNEARIQTGRQLFKYMHAVLTIDPSNGS